MKVVILLLILTAGLYSYNPNYKFDISEDQSLYIHPIDGFRYPEEPDYSNVDVKAIANQKIDSFTDVTQDAEEIEQIHRCEHWKNVRKGSYCIYTDPDKQIYFLFKFRFYSGGVKMTKYDLKEYAGANIGTN